MVEIAEKAFESAIEATLLSGGPDAVSGTANDLASPPTDYYFGKPGGYRIQQTYKGRIKLERGEKEITPRPESGILQPGDPLLEPLSRIIRELNARFGTDFTEEDRVFIEQLEQKLAADLALAASVRVNTPENARLTFDHIVGDRLQDMIETNFEFYKRVTDDKEFARFFLDWLFDRFAKGLPGK